MKWGGESDIKLADLCVNAECSLFEAMQVLERGGEAIAFVCDSTGRVLGSLTDGDIRRAILRGANLQERCLRATMKSDFVYVSPDASRAEVLDTMRARDIGQLPVLGADGTLIALHTVGRLLNARKRDNWVVLMAGGRGSRLQPITNTVPKPMVKVAGRPILERLILHVMGAGFHRFYISVNYLGGVIEEHFGDGSRLGCRISYLREERPLGTGGSLSLLPAVPELPVLVLNGDLVTQCDLGGMLEFHETGKFAATFGLKSHNVEIPFGVARVEGNRLVELREKPSETVLINAGMYVLSPNALQLVKKDEDLPITDLVHRCIANGLSVGAHVVADEWIDVGRLDDLRRARGES